MNNGIFTIYDSVSESYDNPIIIRNAGEAKRGLLEVFQKDPEHRLAKFRNDFTLYEIGSFDQQTGKLTLHDEKTHVCNLSNIQ